MSLLADTQLVRRCVARQLHRHTRRHIKLRSRQSHEQSEIVNAIVLANDATDYTVYPDTLDGVQEQWIRHIARAKGAFSAMFIVTDETARASANVLSKNADEYRLTTSAIEVWHSYDDCARLHMDPSAGFSALLPAYGCLVVCHPIDTLIGTAHARNTALSLFLQEQQCCTAIQA